VDVKPLADVVKDSMKRYGFWRVTLAIVLVVGCWRLPDIITALSAWR